MTKPKLKATPVAQAVAETTAIHPTTPMPEAMEFFGFQIKAQSWQRTAVAWVLGLSASVGIGAIAGTIVGYALTGAILTGASLLMSILIFIIGLALSFHFGGKAATMIYTWIMTKQADDQYEATINWLRNLMPKATEQVPA